MSGVATLLTVPEGLTMSTLAELRNQSFLTQEDLAKKAGVGQSTIAKIEQGESRPRHKTARALALALGVSPNEIDWPEGEQNGRSR
jgi:transcriptional regulator with XRE-family HTH domain